ncbi:MAG: hypothetical protein K2J39_06730 [Ruminococcus sp.]|nr:hypothetical protein [Ruminococcus sp.]
MACKSVCRLMRQAYNKSGCKYCIVIAQKIPTTTTINAPVVITIGTGTADNSHAIIKYRLNCD